MLCIIKTYDLFEKSGLICLTIISFVVMIDTPSIRLIAVETSADVNQSSAVLKTDTNRTLVRCYNITVAN